MELDAYVFPASFSQQRLWFLDQLVPGSPAYNISAAYRILGPLNVPALELGLSEVIKRHEALRTTFAAVDGQPVQIIAPVLTLALPIVDLRQSSGVEQEAELLRLAVKEARQPFNLARGPLLRAVLVRLAEEEHLLVLTTHHIISDAWSMGVLRRELSVLYGAFSTGKPALLPELSIQYADYAVWQQDWLQGENLETQLDYWKKQLDGAPPWLELPTARRRPTVQSYQGTSQSEFLSRELTQALKDLSQQEGATLFMTLLAAFKVLLFRYTGHPDVVVGTAVANRGQAEMEAVIGFFVNNLVLRTDLSGDPTFRELLARVREVCLGAYAHQETPFERLVAELQPERDLGRNPLFQVMFVLQNVPEGKLALEGLEVTRVDVESNIAHFDLTLYMVDTQDGLRGKVAYSSDLFDDHTMTRMLGHLRTLLQGIVIDPDQQIGALPLLTHAEFGQHLGEWNDSLAEYPKDSCIHHLVEAQVKRTPDTVAVAFQDQHLTYHELNVQANRLAHLLYEQGIKPGMPVGIYAARSLDLIVAMLAALKAGAPYVPLDVDYPRARLAYMLQDARVPLLLTQEALLDSLPSFSGRVLCLDQSRHIVGVGGDNEVGAPITPDHPAYIVYTSGSTGRPKGILTPHRGVVNYLAYLVRTFDLNENSIVLQLPAISFDASVRDIFGPLAAGGRVVLPTQTEATNPADLLSLIEQYGVNCLLSIVPSMLRAMYDASRAGDIRAESVDLILSSGESLLWTDWEKACEIFGNRARIVNQYGPTECTMTSSYYPIVGIRSSDPEIRIGGPIPNADIHILDGRLNLVPVDIPGELCIGGIGLTQGYLNQPGLTAAAFIPHPFSREPGARLYRTGDLARRRPDGSLEFLGRIDHQVKLRGYRIEMGEIEMALSQHPLVREVAVLSRENLHGAQALVAYLAPSQEPGPTADEMRTYLRQMLPEYMLPSAYVTLDALPLTPNLKVDHRALPAPDWSRRVNAFVAPRTPVEEELARIWSQVLGVERVGVHDNFFALGGHSLLATQIVAHVRDACQVELPLRSLFEVPTVEGLAELVETLRWATQGPPNPVHYTEAEREEGEL